MTLERHVSDTGNRRVVMTECPACGYAFPENSGMARHQHFLDDHDPTDFGLAPPGERHTRWMGRVRND
jgi:hypothetical protein